ncbi:MAG TPA: nuclear transport factor 2 family protein [Acidimicrobiales bacterium]|nr:nuclear transport factor 2 family protein [Acidimicrobiales bacterium]
MPAPVAAGALSVAQSYVRTFNAGDLAGMERLFAERAVLRHPRGRFSGRDAIMAFYRDAVFERQANLTVAAAVIEGGVCIMELVGRLLKEPAVDPLRIRDVFRVGPDGRITELAVSFH